MYPKDVEKVCSNSSHILYLSVHIFWFLLGLFGEWVLCKILANHSGGVPVTGWQFSVPYFGIISLAFVAIVFVGSKLPAQKE